MATPDPRLFELVAALAEVGADWLGLEILDAVRNGFPREASGEDLQKAQLSARLAREPRIDKEQLHSFAPEQVLPDHLFGDDQLTWAAAYVVERLTDEAEMLNASFEQLNIVSVADDVKAEQIRERVPRRGVIALQIGEDGPVHAKVDVAALRTDIAELNAALQRWVQSVSERQ